MSAVAPLRPPRSAAGRPPPADLDAEAAVLSACLLKPDAVDDVVGIVQTRHFFNDANRLIFEGLRSLRMEGRAIDVVQVASWLRDRDRLAQVGGAAYLAQIVDATPAVAHVAAHAQRVRKTARDRAMLTALHRCLAEGYSAPEGWARAALEELSRIAEDEPSNARLTTLDGAAIAAPLPKTHALVPSLDIGSGACVLVAGDPYAAKTMSLQSAALSVAAGRPLWGTRHVNGRGGVAHLDFEQGQRLTRERYQRLARSMGVDLAALGSDLLLVPFPPRLTEEGMERELVRVLRGRALAIVDSLRACAPELDENSSAVRGVLDMLGSVSDKTGCVVLVVHHTRKPSQADMGGARASIRGSGAIFDACSSVLVFTSAKGEPTTVSHEKARASGILADDFRLSVEDVEGAGDDGRPDARWGVRVVERGTEEAPADPVAALERRVLVAVRPGDLTSVEGIRLRVGARKADVSAVLNELKTKGRIVLEGGTYRVA